MDVMRKAIYMLSVLCVAALWGGCQRGGGEEGTAEVTLRFATRADGTDGTDPNALPNEGIKTLRIVLYHEDGTFYRSEWRSVNSGGDGAVLATSVRIYDVPLGKYRFYIIANEESVGGKYGEEVIGEYSEETFRQLSITDVDNTYFPKKENEIAAAGLPMAGQSGVVTVEKGMESLEITLERTVVKLKVTLINATYEDMTVESIDFGRFIANGMNWFAPGVPTGVSYQERSFVESTSIATGGRAEFVYYVYPSRATGSQGQSAYTMGLQTSGSDYEKKPFVRAGNSGELSRMNRNEQYNIQATVNQEGIVFNASVDPWGESHAGGDINIGGDEDSGN